MKLPSRRRARDTLLFFVGLAGIVYETFTNGAEKPTLIIAFVGMLGLPLFIQADEFRKQRSNGNGTNGTNGKARTPTDTTPRGRHAGPEEET